MIPQTMPSIDWTMLLPVIAVVGAGAIAILLQLVAPKRTNNAIVTVSLVGLLASAVLLVRQFGLPDGETFGGMVARDATSLGFQLLIVGACFVCVLFSEGYLREKGIAFGEFYPLALWASVGGMLMVGAKSLLMVFLGLETLSIPLYCMAGMSRREGRSGESALKYFLLGAFASAFLLYGIAFLYGASGSLRIDGVSAAIFSGFPEARSLALFGVGLVLVGLGFKAALFPFHQWTPDVYQGAPTNVTAFMAAVSKIAAIGALARVLLAALPLEQFWFPAVYWMAILTMFAGNLIALRQKDVKRVLAYSSIAHAGYILVALLAHLKDPAHIGLGTTVFYLLSYCLMTVGAFAVVALAAKGGKEGTRLQDLHGLWQRSPFAAGSLVVFVVSLIGIPPTAGFFGKLQIFGDAVSAGLMPLAILLAINSAISAYYYVGIAVAATVQEEGALQNQSARASFGTLATCVLCALGVLGASFAATPIQKFMSSSPSEAVQLTEPPHTDLSVAP